MRVIRPLAAIGAIENAQEAPGAISRLKLSARSKTMWTLHPVDAQNAPTGVWNISHRTRDSHGAPSIIVL
jgi:hypothetical protein